MFLFSSKGGGDLQLLLSLSYENRILKFKKKKRFQHRQSALCKAHPVPRGNRVHRKQRKGNGVKR